MKTSTAVRILADDYLRGSPRKKYWRWREDLRRWSRLLQRGNRDFARVVLRDQARYLGGRSRPIAGESGIRARAAADWLVRAQDVTPDDGVSAGYFPCVAGKGHRWRPSYPETTGYIIPSLLEYADRYEAPGIRERAIRMAVWESEIQMPSGAVQGGYLVAPAEREPAVFNTGMVLFGYTAVLGTHDDRRIQESARMAADFLVEDQGNDGHFRTHGKFVTQTKVKTYNCLCAWGLHRYGEYSGDEIYKNSAIRAVEAAIGEQAQNGWFGNNCLDRPEAPLLHTIGYTLQGILETGILAGRDDFIAAVKKGVDPVIRRMSSNGFLHGRYYTDWEPASFSCCLTGSAQVAVVCYRLYETVSETPYRSAADRILNFLKRHQVLDCPDDGAKGALAGSFPIMGRYEPGGYPNWATKYLLDALMLQERLSLGRSAEYSAANGI